MYYKILTSKSSLRMVHSCILRESDVQLQYLTMYETKPITIVSMPCCALSTLDHNVNDFNVSHSMCGDQAKTQF